MVRAFRFLAPLSVLVALSAGSALPRASDDPAAHIQALLEHWRLDFNARRAAHICDLFAPSLRYDFQSLPEQNYTLLCDRLNRALSDHAQSLHYELHVKEVIVSGSLAVVRLTWFSTLSGSGGRAITHEEPGLDVFRRQPDGSWKIIRFLAYQENPR